MSHTDELELGIESTKVVGIGGYDGVAGAASTDDHVRIGEVCGSRRGQELSDERCVGSVERDRGGSRLAEQSHETDLARWDAHDLCEGSGWHEHFGTQLARPNEECDNAAVVALEGDQPSGIERDTGVHATDRLAVCSTSSAQRRSSSVSGPPLTARASSSVRCHPAASSSATPMACWTNPETDAA